MNELLNVPRHELHRQRYLYIQPQMTQIMLQINPVVDGNACTLVINGRSTTFEFDNNASVTAGRVPVTIGGSGPVTGANFAAAVASVYGDVVRCVNDGAWEYIIANTPDLDLTVSIVSGTIVADRTMVQRPQQPMAVAFLNRNVTASDMTRTLISIYTGIDTIYYLHVIVRTSGSNLTIVPWNGVLAVSGEIVQLAQGTAGGLFALGNLVQLIVMGDKIE